MVSRRLFLKGAAVGAATCACCAAAGIAHASEGAPHWTYEGAEGPEHWGDLSADFKTCQIGTQQTPIDLTGGVKASLNGPLKPALKPMPLNILNNGHTIQVNAAPGSSTTIEGIKYDLVQFHFHHPSEHLLSGKPFEMEVHFVHKSATGGLAVLGAFITLGAPNPALGAIFAAMPAQPGEVKAAGTVDPNALLPKKPGYFRYMGSLTTPPCSENLLWTVYKNPVTASKAQIEAFAKLFENDARPVQKRNNRFVLEVAG